MQKKYENDLEEFLKLTKTKRGIEVDPNYPDEFYHLNFYQLHSEAELQEYINKLQLKDKELDDYTFNYYVNCIIKFMSGKLDAHTSLKFPKYTVLPYYLKMIDNDLYIDYSSDSKINKAKIFDINCVKIDELIASYEQSVCYGNLEHFFSEIERYFNCLESLYSLPVFKRLGDSIEINTDKGILKINLNDELKRLENFTKFIPYEKIDKLVIFRYSACNRYFEKIIPELIDYLEAELNNSEIDTFVLDLRNNGGGFSSIIRPLIDYLQNTNLKLYTIVNRGVFSSGRWAIIDMQRIGSKIIGEEIGTPLNCFGYALKSKPLSFTNQQPVFAKAYWYLNEEKYKMEGIFLRKELIAQNKDFFSPKHLKLDYEIKETVASFKDNKDLCLNFIINQRKMENGNRKI